METIVPVTEWKPASVVELSRLLSENAAGSKRPVIPVGGRTGLRLGGSDPQNAIPVVLSELAAVVDYPTGDLTITVEAGMRIDVLNSHLKAANQRLPIDIPVPQRATVGGAIASDVSGPSRFGQGTFRDYVIGITAVDGMGRIFSAGGRVVKNVAGYDLCKLLTGSQGTLGIITQVTLKLKPIPAQRGLVVMPIESLELLDQILVDLNTSVTRPVILDVLNSKANHQIQYESRRKRGDTGLLLCVGYEGSEVEVDWQIAAVCEELHKRTQEEPEKLLGDAAGLLWNVLTEFQVASDDPITIQSFVLPSKVSEILKSFSEAGIACQAHAGNGVIVGHLPDNCSTASSACELLKSLTRKTESLGGSLRILNCEADFKQSLVKCVSTVPELKLHQQIKQTLDPFNLLSPGRLLPESDA